MPLARLAGDSNDAPDPAAAGAIDAAVLDIQHLLTEVRAALPAMPPEYAGEVQVCLARMETLLTRLAVLARISSADE